MHRSWCKECGHRRVLSWRRANPDKVRDYNLRANWAKFGFTLADFERMLAEQGGVCAICGGEEQNRGRLSVDHDHETGKIRGLLCDPCNNLLGRARDNVDVLRAAIAYLEKHK